MGEEWRVTNEYLAFVKAVKAFGMPVNFLLEVGAKVGAVYWDEGLPLQEEWEAAEFVVITPRPARLGFLSPALRKVYFLHFGDFIYGYMHDPSRIDPHHDPGEEQAIQAVYHESTHAYLDVRANDPKVAEIIRDGIACYKDAPMTDGSTCINPERLFTEAAAGYVGHRSGKWWSYFELLSAVYKTMPADRWPANIASIRNEYNQNMGLRTFGYEKRGSEQLYTTRGISRELRAFCDHELLEDKIPDDFDTVPAYQQMLNSMIGAVQFHFVR